MLAMFVDLRAVFDSVDKEMLVEAMKEKGIREGLISRGVIKRDKKQGMKREGRRGDCFWAARRDDKIAP